MEKLFKELDTTRLLMWQYMNCHDDMMEEYYDDLISSMHELSLLINEELIKC
jgi:hypothetical protein